MINIQKTGNAIVVDFTDNDKYLNNGTIEVAPNELMVVIDDSNMATFKKMSNGDTLFGQLIDQIKIQGQSVTKDNIIEKFGTIGFSISGGGGAVNSVNGQTGDVVITATSLGAITKADADTLYAAKSDLDSKANISTVEALSTEVAANRTATTALTSKVNEDSEKIASLDTEMDNKANSADVPTNTQFNNLSGEVANKADKTSVYTKAEADEKFATNVGLNQTLSEYATNVELNHVKEELATKADTSSLNALKSEITGLATKEELANYQPIGDYATTTQLNSKQDTLVSGTNIKTVNGESILGNGNIVIQSGTSNWDDIQGKPQFAGVATSGDYNDLINKPIIPDVSDLATKEEIADMETKSNAAATYATKDEIPSLEGYLTETKASETYATKQELGNKLDTATYNSEKAGFETKENAAATYQVKGDYATKQEIAGKQDTLVSGTNIKTINGQSVIGEGNIDITEGGTIDSELSTDSENPVQNKVITNALNDKASKTELSNVSTSKANKADVYTKQEIDNKFTNAQNQINQLSTDTSAINTEVQTLKTDKQDTLVSGTNIKTINGQSLLGEGNIEIQQSIASADTLGVVKVGTGLSINPEGVLSANAPEWNNISGKPEDIVNITERLASKLDTATYNSEKSSFATKDELNSKADASAITDMATQTWVQGQGYLTEVPSNYVTDTELTEGLAGKQDKGDYALKSDLNTLATKEELATKADASALSSKQDTLVSGTNIKTINGETILGAGDIVIQAGGTIDTAMSDTSENAVQNKVIKAYIDSLVGNILTQLQEINGTN